jgi:hypothetical protein
MFRSRSLLLTSLFAALGLVARRRAQSPDGLSLSPAEDRLPLAAADKLARSLTGGEVSIRSDGFQPLLVHARSPVYFPLHAEELTEARIRSRLADWRSWPN